MNAFAYAPQAIIHTFQLSIFYLVILNHNISLEIHNILLSINFNFVFFYVAVIHITIIFYI